jgi:starch-binding outer membrane protein SusE/F
MKNILKIFIGILLTSSLFNSCTDSESTYVAIPPIDGELLINPTATTIILSKANKDQTAIGFSWNVSDYGVNTPLQYTLEIDAENGDFSDPETEVTENTTLSLTHAKLNAIALSMDLNTNVEGKIKVRLKTSLNYGALPSYSKIETITVTPYEDLFFPLPLSGELYLQGDALPSNWGYPVPANQKLTKIPNKAIFTITRELIGNRNFAFISSNMGWGNPAYVGLVANQPATGGSFTENGSNTNPPWIGSPIKSPPLTGIYEITIDFVTGKYTVTPQ